MMNDNNHNQAGQPPSGYGYPPPGYNPPPRSGYAYNPPGYQQQPPDNGFDLGKYSPIPAGNDAIKVAAFVGLGVGALALFGGFLAQPLLILLAFPGLVVSIVTLAIHSRSSDPRTTLNASVIGLVLNAVAVAMLVAIVLLCSAAFGELQHWFNGRYR